MNGLAIEKVGEKTRQSVKWSFALQIFQKIFFFISSIALARLLIPRDFGVASIALTLDNITWLVTSMGINSAVIHFQDNIEERLNAAFWLFLSSSLLVVTVLIIASPYIAAFYKEPLLINVIRLSAVAMFITCISSIHRTIMVKNIEFKKISIYDGGLSSLKSILYMVLAFWGFGIWSFIYPKIITSIIGSVVIWNITGWRPKFKFNFKYWADMFKYGKNVLLSNLIDYSLNYSSYILIGSMLGAGTLGLYTFAYDKSMLILNNITYPVTMISFPAYSRLQNHKEKLKDAFFKSMKLISILTFPITIGQIILGPEYIKTVFGGKWHNSILIFQMLLIYSLLRSICQCGTPMLQGIGKPHVVLRWNLIYAPVFISSLYLGFKLGGMYGIAAATAIIGSIWAVAYVFIIVKELNWTIYDVYNVIKSSLYSSIIMGVVILPLKILFKSINIPNAIILATLVPTGILIYFLSIKLFFHETYGFITLNMQRFLGTKNETGINNVLQKQDNIKET